MATGRALFEKAQQAELVRLTDEFARNEGTSATAVPFLSLLRASKPTALRSGILEPSLCLVVRGEKRLLIGKTAHRYGAGHYVSSAIEFPTSGHVVGAPYLAVRIAFDPREIAQVIVDGGIDLASVAGSRKPAVHVGAADRPLTGCIVRLLSLLEEPAAGPFLAAAIKRELIYRLLQGDGGAVIYQSVRPANLGIGRAIDWLRQHFDRPMDIDALARQSHMSISALRHEFKSATALAPLQFQKQLRLQEARRLLLAGEVDAGTAAFRVGYESPSQFSREYRRMFGAPPIRDVQRLEPVS
jgi:AraC-like DNA-binding protein